MALKEYNAKRDFSRTAEPSGRERQKRSFAPRSSEDAWSFVVQKHAARRLHYDFRLEMEGVLKSWAVPKGFPFKKGERHLAVHVEDHPIEYANFEGTIAEGNYGAGTVMVWDRGTYDAFGDDPLTALNNGKLHLRLSGEKLKGEWTLIRLRGSNGSEKSEWLLLKSGDDVKPISQRLDDHSVISKRSMKQIEEARDAEWPSNRPATSSRIKSSVAARVRKAAKKTEPEPKKDGSQRDLSGLPSAAAAFIAPMKCLFVDDLPRGADWTYEIKFDGYRAIAVKKGKNVALFSRNEKNFTRKYPMVAECIEKLELDDAVLDGEIVALDENGRPTFQLLQSSLSAGSRPPPVVFYAFDILQMNGRDLRGLPLTDRKELLRSVIGNSLDCVRFSAGLDADPKVLAREMQARGLEGLIAKRRDSKYESGRRSGAWAKFKWSCEQEFVIGGYTKPEGARSHFGAILVGFYESNQLRFASKVGTGFDEKSLRALYVEFQKLRRSDPPFVNVPEKRSARGSGQGLTAAEMRRCTWIEPKLVCQVRFTEWTRDNHLRHPVFLGLREDKEPTEVVREGEGGMTNDE